MQDYRKVLLKYLPFFIFNLVAFTVLKAFFQSYSESIESAFLVIIGIFIGMISSSFKSGQSYEDNKIPH